MNKEQELISYRTTGDIREYMRQMGWSSADSLILSPDGYILYKISFTRCTWHGVAVGGIMFYSQTECEAEIDRVVYKTAKRALSAWERFTEEVPHQLADGTLEVDLFRTNLFKMAKGAISKEKV